ncbi:MAG: hypothetical protein ACHBN1_05595 [Heteroscytonema crispum UTEX LB 1556]
MPLAAVGETRATGVGRRVWTTGVRCGRQGGQGGQEENHQRPFGRTSTRREILPQYALHHQPLRGDASWDARLLEGRFALRYRVALHQSPIFGKPYLWARSEPGGIFPTADASAPSPPTTNS